MDWLLVDGRPFINSLRSDGEIVPSKDDCFRLASILEQAGCISFEQASVEGRPATVSSALASPADSDAGLKTVISGLKGALTKAKKISAKDPVAKQLASEISALISKYQ
jgi:hypothetical protein